MPTSFMIYGANGFVGAQIARLAVSQGLQPILAGRSAAKLQTLANELGAEVRSFSLDDPAAIDAGVAVVVDLPVVIGHEILADEQRLAIEHPDPPVEVGVGVSVGRGGNVEVGVNVGVGVGVGNCSLSVILRSAYPFSPVA